MYMATLLIIYFQINCNVYIDAFYQDAWVTLFNKNVVTFKETKVKSCNIKNKSGISNFKTFRFCFVF